MRSLASSRSRRRSRRSKEQGAMSMSGSRSGWGGHHLQEFEWAVEGPGVPVERVPACASRPRASSRGGTGIW